MNKHGIQHTGILGFVFVLAGLNLLLSATSLAEVKPQYGGEYRAPLISEPITLDPALYTDIYSFEVAANLFDGLVAFNSNLKEVPAIAQRWKISRDHLTYTFFLRKGVKFHNGREVIADDFVYSFQRIIDPAINSPVAGFFSNIQGARAYQEGKSARVAGLKALNRYTLQIQLEKPFAPFLSILAMINAKVIPQEAVSEDFAKNPVGTGPFRLRSWKSGEAIVLEANKDYFAGRPFIDRLRFRIYQNLKWEQVFVDFQRGELEHAFVPSGHFGKIVATTVGNSAYRLIQKTGLNLVYIGLNQTVIPFNDARIRRAVNYAIDRETIVKQITKRGAVPNKGILPPGLGGYDPAFQGYPFDQKKAKALLAEAGYPQGHGFPSVELWTVSKSESVHQELKAYRDYLADVGLHVTIKVAEDWKTFVGAIQDGKAAMFYAAWYADYPDADNFFYPLFHSQSNTNRMGFANSEVDRLIDAAREETNYARRTHRYREIQKRIMHDAPIISQHTNSFNYLFRASIKGLQMNHLGSIYLPFRAMWLSQPNQGEDIPQR